MAQHDFGKIYFSQIYATDNHQFRMLATAPSYDIKNQLAGLIVFEINMNIFYDVIQDKVGLGDTGEIMVVKAEGQNALVLNRLRHDPDSALKRRIVFDKNKSLPSQVILNVKPGWGYAIDYRGKRVLALWRDLKSANWTVVTKIDVPEAFDSIYRLKQSIAVLGIITAMISILIAILLSRSITEPIRSLLKGVDKIGEGDLDYKFGITKQDEIGALSRSFDQMTLKLKSITASRDDLNREIAERRHAEDALQKSEKNLRDLVEHSLTGISILQDDQIVYQNPEQERLLGPLPRPIQFSKHDKIHPDDIDKIQSFYNRMNSGEVETMDVDFRFYPLHRETSDVNLKWAYCRASKIDYQGKKALLVNIMDLTQYKQLEQLIRLADKMSSLGRVAAGIAHEIRNPLSGINIYLDTLKKTYRKSDNPEKIEMMIERIKDSSNKIEKIIRRVMDFAKPSEPRFVRADINQPIKDAISLSAVTLRKSKVELSDNLSADLPPAYIDPHMLEQVLLNMITNAVEAVKANTGQREIEIASYAQKHYNCIRIADTGPGIPIDIQKNIFDPFYTTKKDGSGIGLSICHRIITDHRGALEVGTSKWGGAQFLIKIPNQDFNPDETINTRNNR